MITLTRCRDWQETQLLKSMLESKGIAVFVPDEMSNLDGLQMHFGGFRIEVADEDAGAAKAVLDSVDSAPETGEPEAGDNPSTPG
jgi:hypothetical protein